MAGWVGPALVAAVIAALVSVMGWFVTAGLTLRAEQRRREEKTRDFMIALRAEIRSELDEVARFDLEDDLMRVRDLYEQSDSYRVFVPRMVENAVTKAVTPEIFILPERVIDPVVVYIRQREDVRLMIEEIRAFDGVRYGRQQEISLYADLNTARARLYAAARAALASLERLP